MANQADLLKSLVPITQFNRGQASRIFDKLKSHKQLIVLKNNQPSAIILSPQEYQRLLEIEEDYLLLTEANTRLEGKSKTFTSEEVMEEFGITKEDLSQVGDIEIG